MHRSLFALVLAMALGTAAAAPPDALEIARLASTTTVGDVVFIRVPSPLFRRIAEATGSWTNHVGIVVDVRDGEPIVAESRVPFSSETTLARFVARSERGRVAVLRLDRALDADEVRRLQASARAREGVLYDTGFDLHSRRQFCSRFVREVMLEATGVALGDVETFATLLARSPDADLVFWRRWYFGHVPWARETVTPGSVLSSAHLRTVFDGSVASPPRRPRLQANTSDT
jgi:hypothetical protein